jgi:hypothetical protein
VADTRVVLVVEAEAPVDIVIRILGDGPRPPRAHAREGTRSGDGDVHLTGVE